MENTKFNKAKNNKLLINFILFFVLQWASVILYAIGDYFDLIWAAKCVVMTVFCFLMYRSYATHTKNVMKPLLGAALALLLFDKMTFAMYEIQNFNSILEVYPNRAAVMAYVIFHVALFAVLALINILHYSINATHHSSPGKIKANKILCILFVIIILAQCVCVLFVGSKPSLILSKFTGLIADVFVLNIIVGIESNLDEYRIAREAEAEAAKA